ncbi:PHD and RING finger domain-containing protein 1-like isoform X2 [Notolabrus celidotus]|uniref:PHD and RING finger domain-containing protein 1-like isoform X2 n=1 Tax=Notolabrus celidotus TaxID=1203425 RepID=UPI00148F9BBB|nr:PHD and RING finger domain-containing protein 1-like isoform X2 [Notolabrus celidotus]
MENKPCVDDVSSDKCYICLSPFEQQEVGSLESCQHEFCLQCILQWSQTANTCPVDRISFAFILQRRCPGGDIQNKIKVRTRRNDEDDEEEEGSSVVICEKCGRSDRRHRLLVCMQCDSGYHMDCLTPQLTTVPEGYWTCPECAVSLENTDGSLVEEEISDGELTDLLAEADETPSTSSRLRPSTVNRPGGSTEQRRSQRVQSRASINPNPPPRTCWHVPKYLLRASRPEVPTEEVAPVPPSDTSDSSDELKKRKRRKRAA